MNASSLLSLQRFYSTAQVTPQTPPSEIQRKAAESRLPDPELAAKVARFLPMKGSAARPFTPEEISEAFLQLLLSEGSDESPATSRKRWKKAVREQGKALGSGAVALHDCVVATGMGRSPSLADVEIELGDLWEEAV